MTSSDADPHRIQEKTEKKEKGAEPAKSPSSHLPIRACHCSISDWPNNCCPSLLRPPDTSAHKTTLLAFVQTTWQTRPRIHTSRTSRATGPQAHGVVHRVMGARAMAGPQLAARKLDRPRWRTGRNWRKANRIRRRTTMPSSMSPAMYLAPPPPSPPLPATNGAD